MYFILYSILSNALFIYLLFAKPMKIFFLFDSDKMDMHISANWMSLIKLKLKIINLKAHITIHLFNIKIFSGSIKRPKRRRKTDTPLSKALSFHGTSIRSYYGLNRPDLTGIICGVVDFISNMTDIDEFEQFPSFAPGREYLRIEARSNLYIGKTIINIVILLARRLRRKNYGPVKLN